MADFETQPSVGPVEGSARRRWLTPGVWGIRRARLLADVGHETPTALLADLVPPAVQQSVEFTTLCPDSALVMVGDLSGSQPPTRPPDQVPGAGKPGTPGNAAVISATVARALRPTPIRVAEAKPVQSP